MVEYFQELFWRLLLRFFKVFSIIVGSVAVATGLGYYFVGLLRRLDRERILRNYGSGYRWER